MPRRKTRRLRGGEDLGPDRLTLAELNKLTTRVEQAMSQLRASRSRPLPPSLVAELNTAFVDMMKWLATPRHWTNPTASAVEQPKVRAFELRDSVVEYAKEEGIPLDPYWRNAYLAPPKWYVKLSPVPKVCGLKHIPEPFRKDMVSLEDIPEGTLMTEYQHKHPADQILPHSSVVKTTGHIPSELYRSVYDKRDQTGNLVGMRVREYKGRGRRLKTRRKSRK